MRIYLTGGWGYGNIGDEAILMSMLRSLTKELGNPKIVVTSFDPRATQFHHGLPSLSSLHRSLFLRRVPQRILPQQEPSVMSIAGSILLSPRFLPNVILLVLWAMVYWLTGKHFLPDRTLRTHVREIERSDLVIMGGGGYFNDLWWHALPARLAEIWVSKVLGKKVMIYGQTIGPFNTRFSELFFARFLNRVDFITFRDAQSEMTLLKYGYDKEAKALLTADEANLLAVEQHERSSLLERYGLDPDCPTIGIMFQNFRPYTSINGYEPFGRIKTSEQYAEEVERTLLALSSQYQANIIFLPSTSWDTPFCWRLYSQLSQKVGIKTSCVSALKVSEYVALCQTVDVMVSTNMHPVILAMTNNIPSIALSYYYKIDDYMGSIGQQRNVWRMDDFRSEDVVSRVQELFDNTAGNAIAARKAFELVKQRANLNARSAKGCLDQ